jgi:hypothetical protein
MSPSERFVAQTGGTIAVFTRHGGAGKLYVRISCVNAVVEGRPDHSEHGAAIHVGEPHPIRVNESFDRVIEILGWAPLPGPGRAS